MTFEPVATQHIMAGEHMAEHSPDAETGRDQGPTVPFQVRHCKCHVQLSLKVARLSKSQTVLNKEIDSMLFVCGGAKHYTFRKVCGSLTPEAARSLSFCYPGLLCGQSH